MKTIILVAVLYVSWTLADKPKTYRIQLRKRHAIIKRDVSHLLGNQGKSHSRYHYHHHHYDGMEIPSLDTNEQSNDKPQYQIGTYAGIPMMGWFDKNPAFGVSHLPPAFESSKKVKPFKQKEYPKKFHKLESGLITEPPRQYLPAATTSPPGVHYLPPGNPVNYPTIHYLPAQQPEAGINENGYYSEEKPKYLSYPQSILPEEQPAFETLSHSSHPTENQPTYETPQQPTYTENQPTYEGPYINVQTHHLPPSHQTKGESVVQEPIFNFKPIPHPGVDVPSRNYLPVPVETSKPEVVVPSSNYLPISIEQTPPTALPIDTTPSKNYVPVPSTNHLSPSEIIKEPFKQEINFWQQNLPNLDGQKHVDEHLNLHTQAIFHGAEDLRHDEQSSKFKKNPWKPVANDEQSSNSVRNYNQQQQHALSINPLKNQWYNQENVQNGGATSSNHINDKKYNHVDALSEHSQKIDEVGTINGGLLPNQEQEQFHAQSTTPSKYQFENRLNGVPALIHSQQNQWEFNSKANQIVASSVGNTGRVQWSSQRPNDVTSFNGNKHNHNEASSSNFFNGDLQKGEQNDFSSGSAKKHWSQNVQSRYRHKDHSTRKSMKNQKQIKDQKQWKQEGNSQFDASVENHEVLHSFDINGNTKDGRYLRSNENQEAVFNGYEYPQPGYQYPKPATVLEEEQGNLPGFDQGKHDQFKNQHQVKYSTHEQIQTQIKQEETKANPISGQGERHPEEIKYHEQTFTGIKHIGPVSLIEGHREQERPGVIQENKSEIDYLNEHAGVEHHLHGGKDELVIVNPEIISNVLEPPRYSSGIEQNYSKTSSKQVRPVKKYQHDKEASYKEDNKGHQNGVEHLKQQIGNQHNYKELTEKQKFTSGIKDNYSGYNYLQQLQPETPEIDPLHHHKNILSEMNQHKQPAQQYNHHLPQSKYQKVVESHFPSGNNHQKVSDLVISVSQNHYEVDQYQHASKNMKTWNQYPALGKIASDPNKSKIQQPQFYEHSQQIDANVNAQQHNQINEDWGRYSHQANVGGGEYSQPQINGERHHQVNAGNKENYHHQSSAHQNEANGDGGIYHHQSNAQHLTNGGDQQINAYPHQTSGGDYDHHHSPQLIELKQIQQQQQAIDNGGVENHQHQSNGFNGHEHHSSHEENSHQQQSNKFRVIEDYNLYHQVKGHKTKQQTNGKNWNKFEKLKKSELNHPKGHANEHQIVHNQYKNQQTKSNLQPMDKNQYQNDGSKSNSKQIYQNQHQHHGGKSNLQQIDQNQYQHHESSSNLQQIDQNQYEHHGSKSNLQQINHQYQHQEVTAKQQQIVENVNSQHQLQTDFQTEDYGIEFSYGSGNGTGNTKVWLDPTHGYPEQQQEQIDSEENPDDAVEIHDTNGELAEDNKSEDLIVVVHTDLLRGNDRHRNRGRGGHGRHHSRGHGNGRGGGRRHRDDYREEEDRPKPQKAGKGDRRPKPQNAGKDDKGSSGKGKQNLVEENQIYSHPNHNASNGHSQTEPEPYYY